MSFTSMAFWMDQVTRGWLIYELTDSTVQLGLVRGVQAIPIFLLSPIAGSAADRYSRKTQILDLADHRRLDVCACLAVLIFTGAIQPWHVYVTAFGMAVGADLSAAGAGGDHRRRGADENLDQCHRSQLDDLQCGAQHRAGAGRRVDRCVRHRRRLWHCKRCFTYWRRFWTLQLARCEPRVGARGHGGSCAVSFGQSIIEGWKFSWHNEIVRTGLLIAMLASLCSSCHSPRCCRFLRAIFSASAPPGRACC